MPAHAGDVASRQAVQPWMVACSLVVASASGLWYQLDRLGLCSGAAETLGALWRSAPEAEPDAYESARAASEAVLRRVMGSQLGMLFLGSLALSCYALSAILAKTLFLGTLTVRETSSLAGRTLKFAMLKLVFLGAVSTPRQDELHTWVLWSLVWAYFRGFVGLARDRGEALLNSPGATPLAHARCVSLLAGILAQDVSWMASYWRAYAAGHDGQSVGVSHALLWLFDAACVLLESGHALARYAAHGAERLAAYRVAWKRKQERRRRNAAREARGRRKGEGGGGRGVEGIDSFGETRAESARESGRGRERRRTSQPRGALDDAHDEGAVEIEGMGRLERPASFSGDLSDAARSDASFSSDASSSSFSAFSSASSSTSSSFSSSSSASAPWTGYAPLVYYLDAFADVSLLTLTLCHYGHLWYLHGLRLQLIDLVLFFDVRFLLGNLAERVKGVKRHWTLERTLRLALPDADDDDDGDDDEQDGRAGQENDAHEAPQTTETSAGMGAERQTTDVTPHAPRVATVPVRRPGGGRRPPLGDCVVCLEPLRRNAKRLPCGHVFHLHCLQSWLQHSTDGRFSCPLCRRDLSEVVDGRRGRRAGDATLGDALRAPSPGAGEHGGEEAVPAELPPAPAEAPSPDLVAAGEGAAAAAAGDGVARGSTSLAAPGATPSFGGNEAATARRPGGAEAPPPGDLGERRGGAAKAAPPRPFASRVSRGSLPAASGASPPLIPCSDAPAGASDEERGGASLASLTSSLPSPDSGTPSRSPAAPSAAPPPLPSSPTLAAAAPLPGASSLSPSRALPPPPSPPFPSSSAALHRLRVSPRPPARASELRPSARRSSTRLPVASHIAALAPELEPVAAPQVFEPCSPVLAAILETVEARRSTWSTAFGANERHDRDGPDGGDGDDGGTSYVSGGGAGFGVGFGAGRQGCPDEERRGEASAESTQDDGEGFATSRTEQEGGPPRAQSPPRAAFSAGAHPPPRLWRDGAERAAGAAGGSTSAWEGPFRALSHRLLAPGLQSSRLATRGPENPILAAPREEEGEGEGRGMCSQSDGAVGGALSAARSLTSPLFRSPLLPSPCPSPSSGASRAPSPHLELSPSLSPSAAAPSVAPAWPGSAWAPHRSSAWLNGAWAASGSASASSSRRPISHAGLFAPQFTSSSEAGWRDRSRGWGEDDQSAWEAHDQVEAGEEATSTARSDLHGSLCSS